MVRVLLFSNRCPAPDNDRTIVAVPNSSLAATGPTVAPGTQRTTKRSGLKQYREHKLAEYREIERNCLRNELTNAEAGLSRPSQEISYPIRRARTPDSMIPDLMDIMEISSQFTRIGSRPLPLDHGQRFGRPQTSQKLPVHFHSSATVVLQRSSSSSASRPEDQQGTFSPLMVESSCSTPSPTTEQLEPLDNPRIDPE